MGVVLDTIGQLLASYLQKEVPGYEPFTPSDPEHLRGVIQPGDVLLVEGNSAPVFFCGMPIADVGPVADTINPILTCAAASSASSGDASSDSESAALSQGRTIDFSFGDCGIRSGATWT